MPIPRPGTRITLSLPSNDDDQRIAIARLVDYVTRKYGGSTISLPQAPVFLGAWVTKKNKSDPGTIVYDDIALVIVDIEHDLNDPEFQTQLLELRAYAFEEFENLGAPQIDIWLVAQSISLYATETPSQTEQE